MSTVDFLLDGSVLGRLLAAAIIGTWVLVLGTRLLRRHIRRARLRRELDAMAREYPKAVVPHPIRPSRSAATGARPDLVALRPLPKGNGRATDTVTSSLADDLRSTLSRRVH